MAATEQQQQSGWYAAVEAQLHQLSDRVAGVVQMVQDFQASLLSDFRKSAQTVADRIDLIKDAVSNQCDDDGSDDVANMSLPQHEVELLDALRASAPATYAALLRVAEQLNDADVFGANAVVTDGLRSIIDAS
jgi:hypothetical protein